MNPSTVLVGDVMDGLRSLPDGCVHCCVTSPPYWGLRDYGVEGQIGLEATPDAFVARMVEVFREVRRVLREDGTLWLNLGDSYAGSARGGHPGEKSTLEGYTGSQDEARRARMTQSRRRDDAMIPRSDVAVDGLKPKDLCMMPWRVALALQADGWWIRSVIVWAKKSPMPESCRDRPTSSWEPIFLLTKSDRYYYDAEAVKEPAETAGDIGGFTPRAALAAGKVPSGNMVAERGREYVRPSSRNLRNVWHLGPEPFSGWTESVQWLPVEADASGDDIRRTPSAGCPVHDRPGSRSGGEREGDPSSRSLGTDGRPEQEPPPEPACTGLLHDQPSPACGSDSPDPARSPTANGRSTRTRRKDRAPETTPPCTPSAQTDDGTHGSEVSREPSDSAEHTTASSSGEGSASRAPGSSDDQTTSRNEGTCTCQYHRRVTKKIDHFATFPTEIPRRAIKAGTSEKGCCPKCGAGWVRMVEVEQEHKARNVRPEKYGGGADGENAGTWTASMPSQTRRVARTLGWSPSCECNAGDPVPALVLDPFLGSGTTVAVARELGRHGVGCELNPEYAKLARERIGRAEKPLTFRSSKATDGGLFTEGHQ